MNDKILILSHERSAYIGSLNILRDLVRENIIEPDVAYEYTKLFIPFDVSKNSFNEICEERDKATRIEYHIEIPATESVIVVINSFDKCSIWFPEMRLYKATNHNIHCGKLAVLDSLFRTKVIDKVTYQRFSQKDDFKYYRTSEGIEDITGHLYISKTVFYSKSLHISDDTDIEIYNTVYKDTLLSEAEYDYIIPILKDAINLIDMKDKFSDPFEKVIDFLLPDDRKENLMLRNMISDLVKSIIKVFCYEITDLDEDDKCNSLLRTLLVIDMQHTFHKFV